MSEVDVFNGRVEYRKWKDAIPVTDLIPVRRSDEAFVNARISALFRLTYGILPAHSPKSSFAYQWRENKEVPVPRNDTPLITCKPSQVYPYRCRWAAFFLLFFLRSFPRLTSPQIRPLLNEKVIHKCLAGRRTYGKTDGAWEPALLRRMGETGAKWTTWEIKNEKPLVLSWKFIRADDFKE